TLLSNPATALLVQSKRFPLVWEDLENPMCTWRRLLPETRCPSTLRKWSPRDWVFKPVFGRVGEDVAIAGITNERIYTKLVKDAERHPHEWIAQRRFDSIPFETEHGPRHACIGVFTVDGCAAGLYGRISDIPLINSRAQDIAVLLRNEDDANDHR